MPVIKKYRTITDSDIPAAIARDAELAAAVAAHIAELNPHSQYLPSNPSGIEFAQDSANYLDFHTGSPNKDFDTRLIASGGGLTNGLGFLLLQTGTFQINALLSLYGGVKLARLLSASTSVDLPLLGAGTVGQTLVAIPGANVGDLALFIPLTMPTNLASFNIQAIVATAGVATIFFHNLAGSAVDVAPFSARLLVLGFS